LFVGGEPGVGKTRLLAEAAGALFDIGVTVLVGGSSPDAGVAYQPFVEMLDHLFSNGSPEVWQAAVDSAGPQLGRLPGITSQDLLEDTPLSGGEARRELFDAVARFFRVLAAEHCLAIGLEDLHWAQLPTLALLQHVVQACSDVPLLVLATFRTTAPDRSEVAAARMAELHRLEGVRRVDLGGLDTDAVAEYVRLRTGLPLAELRAPAALLRDRTGGNPFFLRELWADLESHGGVLALRSAQRVPGSIGDTLATRLAGLGEEVRQLIELAAVLGDSFDLATLVAARQNPPTTTLALLDSAVAAGIIQAGEAVGRDFYFVHALSRQAVLDRMPPSQRTLFHAQAAEALESRPLQDQLVPRLAQHYLAANVLGFHAQALRYSHDAGRLAERSLAFEEAGEWFERAASLPECDPSVRAELLLAAAFDYVRACQFPHAREIYESLASAGDPAVRLAAAMGYEDATWRPGVAGLRAADLLADALEQCQLPADDARYARALGSLGRALALAGETSRARRVGGHAIEVARAAGDAGAISHALVTSLWHGTAAEVADLQLQRSAEVFQLATERRDFESLGSAANFRAMVSYLCGLPEELAGAIAAAGRAAEMTGQPYYRHVYCCLAHSASFLQGDLAAAERWANESANQDTAFGDDTEGPRSVQMFMLNRERSTLQRFRTMFDGREALTGRWVPGLLALYLELGIEPGVRRCLEHLLDRDLVAHKDESRWPLELVFMTEAALFLGELSAAEQLAPLLVEFEGLNLVAGTLIAFFGSADRYLARIDALRGDDTSAERHFSSALTMDRRMHSTVHAAETLAYHARFLASRGQSTRARNLANEAHRIATTIGQARVLLLVEPLVGMPSHGGPDGLTDREVAVLRLLADGLSNADIGARLLISANTAANHVRSILQKTGAANRTQAAMYAAQHHLV
jgi:predicted ATPase/DNA-binding CsgD family transcriptional regulator